MDSEDEILTVMCKSVNAIDADVAVLSQTTINNMLLASFIYAGIAYFDEKSSPSVEGLSDQSFSTLTDYKFEQLYHMSRGDVISFKKVFKNSFLFRGHNKFPLRP